MSNQLASPKLEQILSLFPNSIRAGLVEFAKHIATIETDYIICMARKSVRLLDLLALAGLPQAQKPIFYHYVLAQDLTWLRDKTVTLIDDTLILGTTLMTATDKLQKIGVKNVSTVVFAVDRDTWQKELIQPAITFMELSAEDMLAFCSCEVRAFAFWGIPYISDFPISKEIYLSREKFKQMLEVSHWETHRVSDFDEQSGISAYSAIPIDGTNNIYLEKILGNEIHALCSIVKVRIYRINIDSEHVRIKLVPMITLHPLSDQSIDELFENIIEKLEHLLKRNLTCIKDNICKFEAKLRFVQYVMSSLLGVLYSENFKLLQYPHYISYSSKESTCIFGEHISFEIEDCIDKIINIYKKIGEIEGSSKKIESCDLPNIALKAKDECKNVIDQIYKKVNNTFFAQNQESGELHDSSPINTMWLMEKIFIYFFDTYEITAREEVKKECAKARQEKRQVVLSDTQAPNFNRLRYGFDWDSIASQILIDRGVSDSPLRKLRLSILLDKLVDAGIAVPILCHSEGVVYRAYRHGEGVRFAEYERMLAYNTVAAFLQNSNLPVIKKTTLEKLLVSFLRIGIETKLLDKRDPTRSGPGQTAQIGFYLHGAVAHMPEEIKPIAESTRIWLSSTLAYEGFLAWDDANEGFALGKEPKGTTLSRNALTSVRELGKIFSIASNTRVLGKQALTTDDFILLASCCSKRDTAMALVAELFIIRNSLTQVIDFLLRDQIVRPDAVWSMNRIVDAFKSARLKYYNRNSYYQIVEKMKTAVLKYSPDLDISAERITGYLLDIANIDKLTDKTFEGLTNKCWNHIVNLGSLVHRVSLLMGAMISNEEHYEKAEKYLLKDRLHMNKFTHNISDNKQNVVLNSTRDMLASSFLNYKKLNEEIIKILLSITGDKNRYSLYQKSPKIENIESLKTACVRMCSSVTEDYIHTVELYNKYGSKNEHVKYRYILFYDIINSTCKNLDIPQSDIDSLKHGVADFIVDINDSLKILVQDCKQTFRSEACCVNGDLYSTDDAKHFLIDGEKEGVLDALKLAMDKLLNMARKHEVRVRIILSTTHFAGDCASVIDGSFGSNGRSFWSEFNKTIKKELKILEAGADAGSSFVFLCDELAHMSSFFCSGNEWQHNGESRKIPLAGFFNVNGEVEYTYSSITTAPSQKWKTYE